MILERQGGNLLKNLKCILPNDTVVLSFDAHADDSLRFTSDIVQRLCCCSLAFGERSNVARCCRCGARFERFVRALLFSWAQNLLAASRLFREQN